MKDLMEVRFNLNFEGWEVFGEVLAFWLFQDLVRVGGSNAQKFKLPRLTQTKRVG